MNTKTFIIATAALIATVSALVVNGMGDSTDVGEKYSSSFQYCKTTSYGAKGMSYCSEYATGSEIRQNVMTKGILFSYISYRVVR